MRRIAALFATTAAFIWMTNLGVTSETTDFLQTYGTALEQMCAFFDQVAAEGIVTESLEMKKGSDPTGNVRNRQSRYVYATSHGRTRLVKIIDSMIKQGAESVPHYAEFVYINDSKRSFLAKRTRKDGPFSLVSRGGPDSRQEDSLRDDTNRFFRPFLSFGARVIPDFIKMRAFDITGVSRVSVEGRDLMRVTFRYLPKDNVDQGFTGWWLLDPSRKWLLDQFELKPVSKKINAVFRGSVQYAPSSEEYPLPESVSLTTETTAESKGVRSSMTQKEVMKFSRYSRERVPDRDFTLDSLGLADADLPSGMPSNRATLWFAAVGLAALACSVLFVYLGRHRLRQ